MSSRSSSQSLSNNGSNSRSNNRSQYSRSNNSSGGRRQRGGNERLLNASTDPREFHWRAMKAPNLSRKFVNTSISGVTVLSSNTKPGVDTLSLIMNEIISPSLHPRQYDEQVEQFWRNYILLVAEVDYNDKRVIDVFVYRKSPITTGLTTQHLMVTNDIDLQSFQSLQIAMRIDGSLRITLGNDDSSSYSGSKSKSYAGRDNPRSNNSGYNTPSTSDDTTDSDGEYSNSQNGDGSESSSSGHSSSSSSSKSYSHDANKDDSFDYTM